MRLLRDFRRLALEEDGSTFPEQFACSSPHSQRQGCLRLLRLAIMHSSAHEQSFPWSQEFLSCIRGCRQVGWDACKHSGGENWTMSSNFYGNTLRRAPTNVL